MPYVDGLHANAIHEALRLAQTQARDTGATTVAGAAIRSEQAEARRVPRSAQGARSDTDAREEREGEPDEDDPRGRTVDLSA